MGKQNRRKGRPQRAPAPQQKAKSIIIPERAPALTNSPLRCFFERFASLLRAIGKPLGAVASVATILCTVIAVLEYYHGNLLISVGDNAPLNKNGPTYFFFSMPKDAEDARYLLPVHLQLTNTSNAHDDEVRMIIKYDRKYFRSVLPKEAMTHDASRPVGEQHYEVSSDNAHDYVKFSTTFLSPQATRSFTDGAYTTRISDPKAPLVFNSGVGLDVTVSTYSKGDIHRDWNIRYRGLRVQNDAEIEIVMKDWYAQQLALEIRREAGFWGYIPKLLLQKEVMMYGYSPDFRFIPRQNVFIPASTLQQLRGYRVWPYSWQLLFHSS